MVRALKPPKVEQYVHTIRKYVHMYKIRDLADTQTDTHTDMQTDMQADTQTDTQTVHITFASGLFFKGAQITDSTVYTIVAMKSLTAYPPQSSTIQQSMQSLC